MKLFHMHSRVLNGFYASEVFVAAPNKGAAEELAFDAFLGWLDKELEEYGFALHLDLDDDDYHKNRHLLIAEFNYETRRHLVEVPGQAMILRRG